MYDALPNLVITISLPSFSPLKGAAQIPSCSKFLVTLPKEVTNAKLVHGKYSAEEDAKLVRAMETTPAPSWLEISKLLNRSVCSVENRWDLHHTLNGILCLQWLKFVVVVT